MNMPASSRPRGIFGAPLVSDLDRPLVAPIDISGMGEVGPPGAAQPSAVKPAFFAQGGVGRAVVGNMADALLTMNGGRPIYQPAMQEHRHEAAQQRQQAAEWARMAYGRARDQSDWLSRETWKREHPDDQFTQYMQAAGIDPASPQGQGLYRQRAESMATPPTVAVDGFDAQGNPTKTFMPRAGFGSMGAQPSPSGPAPGTVKNGYRFSGGNPNDRNSWVPVGGASPNGGATFR